MSILKDALSAAAKFVTNRVLPAPQSYLVTEDEDGMKVYQPMGKLYTPENPPPKMPPQKATPAEVAAGLTP